MVGEQPRTGTGQEQGSRPKRRTFLSAVGATGATGLAGCLGTLGSGLTVTWAVVSPMTGPYEGLGPNQRQAARLAVDWINDSDELDVTVEAVYGDTATDPETARETAAELVDGDGLSFLMGGISSGTSLELASFAEERGVVYATGGAAVPLTGSQCSRYVFRFETHTAQIAEACAPWTIENLGGRAWFHVADYAYGNSVLSEWRKRMQQFSNFEEIGVSKTPLGAEDFQDSIEAMKASDAEVVVVGMTGGDLTRFISQAQEMNLPDELEVMTTASSLQTARQALGSDADGIYSGVRYLPKLMTGDNHAFVSAYEDRYDESPGNYARVGYESVRMITRGIAEAGSTDPEDVVDVLPGLELDTIFGQIPFRACDHQAVNPVWVGQNFMLAGNDVADVKLANTIEGPDAIPACEEMGCQM